MFESIFVQPILNLLLAFYKWFLSMGVPYAFGFAIVALTVLFRIIFYPFFKKQLQSQTQMAALKPRLDELQKKYKDDPTRLQQAQMDLYKEYGINPMSGCLFAVIQIPVFIGLYQTLTHFVNATNQVAEMAKINALLYTPALKLTTVDPTFFLFNLARAPSYYKIIESITKGSHIQQEGLIYLAIPLITGVLQYLQARYTMTSSPPKKEEHKAKELEVASETKKDKKASSPSMSEDFQSAMQTQMKYFFPLMIGYFSYSLPVGLSLYWNIFSIFSILQSVGMKKNDNQPLKKTA